MYIFCKLIVSELKCFYFIHKYWCLISLLVISTIQWVKHVNCVHFELAFRLVHTRPTCPSFQCHVVSNKAARREQLITKKPSRKNYTRTITGHTSLWHGLPICGCRILQEPVFAENEKTLLVVMHNTASMIKGVGYKVMYKVYKERPSSVTTHTWTGFV
jgi:hypothetical protein